jgi:hypothetical protein
MNRGLLIALISTDDPPLRTSAAVQLRDLSREFAAQGHRPIVRSGFHGGTWLRIGSLEFSLAAAVRQSNWRFYRRHPTEGDKSRQNRVSGLIFMQREHSGRLASFGLKASRASEGLSLRILMTGSAGFMGFVPTTALADSGHFVRAASCKQTYPESRPQASRL